MLSCRRCSSRIHELPFRYSRQYQRKFVGIGKLDVSCRYWQQQPGTADHCITSWSNFTLHDLHLYRHCLHCNWCEWKQGWVLISSLFGRSENNPWWGSIPEVKRAGLVENFMDREAIVVHKEVKMPHSSQQVRNINDLWVKGWIFFEDNAGIQERVKWNHSQKLVKIQDSLYLTHSLIVIYILNITLV